MKILSLCLCSSELYPHLLVLTIWRIWVTVTCASNCYCSDTSLTLERRALLGQRWISAAISGSLSGDLVTCVQWMTVHMYSTQYTGCIVMPWTLRLTDHQDGINTGQNWKLMVPTVTWPPFLVSDNSTFEIFMEPLLLLTSDIWM